MRALLGLNILAQTKLRGSKVTTEVTEKNQALMGANRTQGHNLEHQRLLGVPLQEYYSALDFSPDAVTRPVGIKVIPSSSKNE